MLTGIELRVTSAIRNVEPESLVTSFISTEAACYALSAENTPGASYIGGNRDRSGLGNRRQSVGSIFRAFLVRREQIPIQPLEVTVDLFISHNLFYSVNCCLMTLHMQLQEFFSVQPLDFLETVVNYECQMRGRARGLAAEIGAFKNGHPSALARQEISRCEPRDS